MSRSDSRGVLLPIGGAEDRDGERAILALFVALSGGTAARIAVLPTASSVPNQVSEQYLDVFTALGVESVTGVPIQQRRDADNPALVAELDRATGLFVTGGDQLKLAALLGGTAFDARMAQRHAEGVVIAGTSAGASAMSRHMIARGESGALPRQGMVTLAPGLGLLENVILDQHFRQRDRLGRLIAAVAYNPALLGIGLDEDTALAIQPDGVCDVLGSGAVTVVDGERVSYTNCYAVEPGDVLSLFGVGLHVLKPGQRFSLVTRQLIS